MTVITILLLRVYQYTLNIPTYRVYRLYDTIQWVTSTSINFGKQLSFGIGEGNLNAQHHRHTRVKFKLASLNLAIFKKFIKSPNQKPRQSFMLYMYTAFRSIRYWQMENIVGTETITTRN